MKDYTRLKPLIRYSPSKEKELDEFLQDTELVALVEVMCKKSNAELPLYIQYLLKKEDTLPGEPELSDVARWDIEVARQERPWIFQ